MNFEMGLATCDNSFNMNMGQTVTIKGADGKDGVDGLSAYQIAQQQGFEGTEQEWIDSLKGEQGIQGEKGEQGIQGEKGEQGIQGEKGDKGDKGEQGESYDDTEITTRVSALENTIGTLNDSLEEVLMGNGN